MQSRYVVRSVVGRWQISDVLTTAMYHCYRSRLSAAIVVTLIQSAQILDIDTLIRCTFVDSAAQCTVDTSP